MNRVHSGLAISAILALAACGGEPVAVDPYADLAEGTLLVRFEANPDLNVSIVPGPGFQGIFMNPWRDPMKVPDFSKPLEELMKEKVYFRD